MRDFIVVKTVNGEAAIPMDIITAVLERKDDVIIHTTAGEIACIDPFAQVIEAIQKRNILNQADFSRMLMEHKMLIFSIAREAVNA